MQEKFSFPSFIVLQEQNVDIRSFQFMNSWRNSKEIRQQIFVANLKQSPIEW